MADKLTQEQVQMLLLGHLTQFTERVTEVVDDYTTINTGDLQQSEKDVFAHACMNDVATLTDIVTQFVHEALLAGGLKSEPPPRLATQADIISLDAYRSNGGLLN